MGARGFQRYAASTYGAELCEVEAERSRERFFAAYPGLRAWHRSQPDGPVETRTLAGRRRLQVEKFTEKLNTPIQGTGADILKLALARLWEDRAAMPAVPVLTVHDEIVLESDREHAGEAATWLKQHMEATGAELLTEVPVQVDATICTDWSGTP